jgi:hypothetical protein
MYILYYNTENANFKKWWESYYFASLLLDQAYSKFTLFLYQAYFA